HVLVDIAGRYNVTWEQLFYQFNITIKYFVVIPAALLFIVTTHPSEFAASLNRIGVPYKIAYAVSIALRYIPDIQRDFRNIAQSQQARGIDLSKKEKLFKRVKNTASIIIPLILSSLDRIEVITNAMELRG
ncbi:TPA: energy-coupling factor transporter transmembrane protein EcfT, partial [Escherichia coli]|nr:energy-coupling factor transporter transmembrane protein EcfT [Escherichia coli]